MTNELAYGREPITIVELRQPRCSLRFVGAPDLRLTQGDTTTGTGTDPDFPGGVRQARVVATFNVSFAASPEGIIWEMGASAGNPQGAYVGVSSGLLTFRAGDSSDLPGTTETAKFTVSATTFANRTGRLFVEISRSPDRIRAWWRDDALREITLLGSAEASAGFPSGLWASGNPGAIGQVNGAAPVGESTANWNGTIAAARFWFGATVPADKLPCTATGGPKCYQTWLTCRDRLALDLTGSITWRFTKPEAGILPLYERTGEDIKTNPIPCLVSVSESSSELNVGSQREGQSPLGIRASMRLQFRDLAWDDHVGDYYRADRSAPPASTFWRMLRARNAFLTDFVISVYEGYRGQALGDMQRRDCIAEQITGPDARGRVTLQGKDPLALASDAQFPRFTDIRLITPIEPQTTTIRVRAREDDLTAAFGNTNGNRFLRIGSEIIRYTGFTLVEPAVYDLTVAQRGALGTEAAQAGVDQHCQRVGRYEGIALWRVAADLIDNHTAIPGAYRDATQWQDEGALWLPTQRARGTVSEPTSVEKLLGELCQQGNFSIWWDERARTIPLLVNRPPQETPVVLSDDLEILADSQGITEDQRAQVSRVVVYYQRRNQASGLTDPANYSAARIFIDGFIEDRAASNEVRTLEIFSRWITSDIDALQTCGRILLRYSLVPKYMTLDLDAKNRTLSVGDVCDVLTKAFVSTEGHPLFARWQVVAAEERVSGHRISLKLQSFQFIGRFASWMPDDAPDYDDATDEEKATGAFWADDTSLAMPGGDEPYLYQ